MKTPPRSFLKITPLSLLLCSNSWAIDKICDTTHFPIRPEWQQSCTLPSTEINYETYLGKNDLLKVNNHETITTDSNLTNLDIYAGSFAAKLNFIHAQQGTVTITNPTTPITVAIHSGTFASIVKGEPGSKVKLDKLMILAPTDQFIHATGINSNITIDSLTTNQDLIHTLVLADEGASVKIGSLETLGKIGYLVQASGIDTQISIEQLVGDPVIIEQAIAIKNGATVKLDKGSFKLDTTTSTGISVDQQSNLYMPNVSIILEGSYNDIFVASNYSSIQIGKLIVNEGKKATGIASWDKFSKINLTEVLIEQEGTLNLGVNQEATTLKIDTLQNTGTYQFGTSAENNLYTLKMNRLANSPNLNSTFIMRIKEADSYDSLEVDTITGQYNIEIKNLRPTNEPISIALIKTLPDPLACEIVKDSFTVYENRSEESNIFPSYCKCFEQNCIIEILHNGPYTDIEQPLFSPPITSTPSNELEKELEAEATISQVITLAHQQIDLLNTDNKGSPNDTQMEENTDTPEQEHTDPSKMVRAMDEEITIIDSPKDLFQTVMPEEPTVEIASNSLAEENQEFFPNSQTVSSITTFSEGDGSVTLHDNGNLHSAFINNVSAVYLISYAEMEVLAQHLKNNQFAHGFWWNGGGGTFKTQNRGYASRLGLNYLGTNIGYSYLHGKTNNRCTGIYTNYSRGHLKYANYAQGRLNYYNLALYHTYTGEKGYYYNAILNYAWSNDNFEVGSTKGKIGSKSPGALLAWGRRINLNTYYLEPHLQLNWHNTKGDNCNFAHTTMRFSSYNSWIGKTGITFGYQKEDLNLYGKLAYLHEFDGKAKAIFNQKEIIYSKFNKNWYKYGIGINYQMNLNKNKILLCCDFEQSRGSNFTQQWAINGGIKCFF